MNYHVLFESLTDVHMKVWIVYACFGLVYMNAHDTC